MRCTWILTNPLRPCEHPGGPDRLCVQHSKLWAEQRQAIRDAASGRVAS